jgi:hypothetical protein
MSLPHFTSRGGDDDDDEHAGPYTCQNTAFISSSKNVSHTQTPRIFFSCNTFTDLKKGTEDPILQQIQESEFSHEIIVM